MIVQISLMSCFSLLMGFLSWLLIYRTWTRISIMGYMGCFQLIVLSWKNHGELGLNYQYLSIVSTCGCLSGDACEYVSCVLGLCMCYFRILIYIFFFYILLRRCWKRRHSSVRLKLFLEISYGQAYYLLEFWKIEFWLLVSMFLDSYTHVWHGYLSKCPTPLLYENLLKINTLWYISNDFLLSLLEFCFS